MFHPIRKWSGYDPARAGEGKKATAAAGVPRPAPAGRGSPAPSTPARRPKVGTGAERAARARELLAQRAGRRREAADRAELARLKAARFKHAGHERKIELLERQAAASVRRWEVGDGVGWRIEGRPGGQVNRGYRIVAVRPHTKEAVIRPVADTGLVGEHGPVGPGGRAHIVHVADLLRDRRYDR